LLAPASERKSIVADKTDIWMPVFIGDYLADTSRLTTEQHGAYFLLLMDYWKNGPLPDNDAILAQIVRLSADAWSMHQAMLKQFFNKGSDGLLHQKRSDLEIAKARANKENATLKAKNAANKRWDKKEDAPSNAPSIPPSNAPSMLELCPSPSPLPFKEVSDANASSPPRDADGGKKDPDELIYAEYPRKEGHRAAIKAIASAVKRLLKGEGGMPPMGRREARIYLYRRAQAYARSPAGQNADLTKIPHPSTWFNQSRYLDDEKHWQQAGIDFRGVASGTPIAKKPDPSRPTDAWMGKGAASWTIEDCRRYRADKQVRGQPIDPDFERQLQEIEKGSK
jgi:uncharacterized protein YdaU (DUF1376 family)